MSVLATIEEETDVIPFLYDMSTRGNTSWAYRVFLSFMYEPLLPEIDLDGNDIVSAEEFARAVRAGTIGADNERHRDILRLFAEWKDYFQSGFLSAPAQGLFSRGQAAMWWGGIWELLPLEADPLRDFEIGTFYVPRITSETSQFADDATPVRMIGGASGVQLAVSRSAIDAGTVEESVDFLMYITTPDNNGRITSESKELAPIIRGAEADESLLSFLEQAENGITTLIIERFFTGERLDSWFRTLQLFLVDDLTLEQATERLQEVYEDAADTLIERNNFQF
jgi:ABC-type glycerol-3-phosphate transport system substrate-binding protein